jgi:hypothetical protein
MVLLSHSSPDIGATALAGVVKRYLSCDTFCAFLNSSMACFMQNLRDVAKTLEAVEKLNKLKVKTIAALHAIPALPDRILNAVVAAVDADDVKEIAGQFIAKVASTNIGSI